MKAWIKAEDNSRYPTWFVGIAFVGLAYVLLIGWILYRVHQAFIEIQLEAIQQAEPIIRKAFTYQRTQPNPELRLRYYGYKKGSKVDTLLRGSKTPLMLAAMAGDSAAVYLLLAKGADFTRQDTTGQTALHYAIMQNNPGVVKLLAHENVMNLPDNYQMTPLLRAIRENKLEYAKLLLRLGAQVSVQNRDGMSVLHLAVARKLNTLLIELIQKGANVNSLNKVGSTPLHVAAKEGNLEAAKILVENGANLNWQNQYGLTPLHYAIEHQKLEVVEFLMQKKALVNIKDKNGQTPLALAKKKNNYQILRILENTLK